jgi:hypothetical protein
MLLINLLIFFAIGFLVNSNFKKMRYGKFTPKWQLIIAWCLICLCLIILIME